ncbi:hypothetical protein HELRODRAFT_75607, partial [Helobdella robusta]|uniref:TSP C-terminal domain-containing protein n=1 Tax=Helobdella robusta TaxID=6412 RepID=T1G272_HELRO
DSDHNAVGDECDSEIDRDDDGVIDDIDNCERIYNPDQANNDDDIYGDACDNDDDNDGIIDTEDNCPLVPNKDQMDSDGDGVGDVCKLDSDGDGIFDSEDMCPYNNRISATDFSKLQTINLDPVGTNQLDPEWVVKNNGSEILQSLNSDPGVALGVHYFGGLDFSGTFFINTEDDDDYAGFVFGYRNDRRFYVVMWKKEHQTYWKQEPFRAVGDAGVQIKVVHSIEGPGEMMRNSLWHREGKEDESRNLFNDENKIGWQAKTSYRWELMHRPSIGLIRFRHLFTFLLFYYFLLLLFYWFFVLI